MPNRDGDPITPSVVLFQGEDPLVGQMAKRSAATAPLDVVQFVKRHMGDPNWRFRTTGDEELVYTCTRRSVPSVGSGIAMRKQGVRALDCEPNDLKRFITIRSSGHGLAV